MGPANGFAGLAAGEENVSAAARSLISPPRRAAEVAEKSCAVFPRSIVKVGTLTCARATLTLPSSNAASNSLFISLPSEGWPHAWIQPRSYGKQHYGPLSMHFRAKGTKEKTAGSSRAGLAARPGRLAAPHSQED